MILARGLASAPALAYRKSSSRGAYGRDPFGGISTGSDGTMPLSINMNSVVVVSVVVESGRCSSKALQGGSCPCAPLDEPLRYSTSMWRDI